ncbi:hypothetical protein [Ekhidna sp.]|uniref:hypothetical protein n=1 Tax=Ekhidna sp. TaxID=2608089 RepID=UPI003CCBE29C
MKPYNPTCMAVMSIRVDEKKRKALKILASTQGKTMSSILSELIDKYIDQHKSLITAEPESEYILRLSKASFDEWDNEEDEIYNEL